MDRRRGPPAEPGCDNPAGPRAGGRTDYRADTTTLPGQGEARPPRRETSAAVAGAPGPTVDDLVKDLAKVTAVTAPPAEAAPVLKLAGEASVPERGFIPPPPVSPGPKSTRWRDG